MSVRRLRTLVTKIPLESAFGDSAGYFMPGWSTSDELLAAIAELLHDNTRVFVMAHSKKGTAAPKRLKIPRPSRDKTAAVAEAPKKRPATSEELAAFFGGAVRFTGTSGRLRCSRGHFAKADVACAVCGSDTAMTDSASGKLIG